MRYWLEVCCGDLFLEETTGDMLQPTKLESSVSPAVCAIASLSEEHIVERSVAEGEPVDPATLTTLDKSTLPSECKLGVPKTTKEGIKAAEEGRIEARCEVATPMSNPDVNILFTIGLTSGCCCTCCCTDVCMLVFEQASGGELRI